MFSFCSFSSYLVLVFIQKQQQHNNCLSCSFNTTQAQQWGGGEVKPNLNSAARRSVGRRHVGVGEKRKKRKADLQAPAAFNRITLRVCRSPYFFFFCRSTPARYNPSTRLQCWWLEAVLPGYFCLGVGSVAQRV